VREWTILVVEDDESIRLGLQDALRAEGYRVLLAADGEEGLRRGLSEDPDLVVLDVMMPKLDGFEVLSRLRADGVDTPVLMLTARGLEADRVKGLDLGADDYVMKPFSLSELRARIRSRLRAWDRERGLSDQGSLRFGAVVVDFAARTASRSGTAIHLTPREFELLAFFAGRPGRAVSRVELLRGVWGDEDVVSRVIDTAILGLRKKIESDSAHPRHIVSVRGLGYRFEMVTDGDDAELTQS
jgi:two-component system alkaline phosphatase synthesis response regulator PhoP